MSDEFDDSYSSFDQNDFKFDDIGNAIDDFNPVYYDPQTAMPLVLQNGYEYLNGPDALSASSTPLQIVSAGDFPGSGYEYLTSGDSGRTGADVLSAGNTPQIRDLPDNGYAYLTSSDPNLTGADVLSSNNASQTRDLPDDGYGYLTSSDPNRIGADVLSSSNASPIRDLPGNGYGYLTSSDPTRVGADVLSVSDTPQAHDLPGSGYEYLTSSGSTRTGANVLSGYADESGAGDQDSSTPKDLSSLKSGYEYLNRPYPAGDENKNGKDKPDKNLFEKVIDFFDDKSHEKFATSILNAVGAVGKTYLDEHLEKVKSSLKIEEGHAAAADKAASAQPTTSAQPTNGGGTNSKPSSGTAASNPPAGTVSTNSAPTSTPTGKVTTTVGATVSGKPVATATGSGQVTNNQAVQDARDAQQVEAEKQRQFLAPRIAMNSNVGNTAPAGYAMNNSASAYGIGNSAANYSSVPVYAPGSVLNAAQFIRS